MDNRKFFNQEGKEAKNFYHLSDDGGEPQRTPPKRPPIGVRPRCIQSHVSQRQKSLSKSGPRVRSASTGRDKKSELQARYWAFLFGNLERSVNEIYLTVECYENLSSCKEAILVLENYIRDFKALAEWFKVSWDYEATPLPQRPHSLAWEVRKSNPVPRVRKQLSSPGMSGKSSPSFSGKNSPCPVVEETGRVSSPKKTNSSTESLSKRCNLAKASRHETTETSAPLEQSLTLCDKASVESYVLKLDQYTQTNLEDENLTLAEYLEKYDKQFCNGTITVDTDGESNQKVENKPNIDVGLEEKKLPVASDTKSEQMTVKSLTKNVPSVNTASLKSGKTQTKTLTVPKLVGSRGNVVRPGPNQALVRKSATATGLSPMNVKMAASLPVKSATVSNMSSNVSTTKHRNGIKQTHVLKPGSAPRTQPGNYNVPGVASRLSVRSKTMIEVTSRSNRVYAPANGGRNDLQRRSTAKLSSAANHSKEDIYSSTSTLKASTDRLGSRNSIVSGSTGKPPHSLQSKAGDRRSEPKSMPSSDQTNNDGWYTVKTKRRSSLLWATRFNQPTGYASLPTLALLDENTNSEAQLEKNDSQAPKENMNNIEGDNEIGHTQRGSKRAVEKPAKPTLQARGAAPKLNAPLALTMAASKPVKQQSTQLVKSSPVSSDTGAKNQQSMAPSSRVTVSRQKSDLTGLKLKTLHKEFLRNEKLKSKHFDPQTTAGFMDMNLKNGNERKGQTISSSAQEGDNLIHLNMVDMNIQTNIATTAIDSLYATCMDERSEIICNGKKRVAQYVDIASQCTSDDQEEQERDDLESDEDQRKLLEEQESLEAQIRELENTEIDFDTETDETDCEAIIDFEDTDATVESGSERPTDVTGIEGENDEDITLEARYEHVLAGMNWVDRARTLDTLKAIVARHPGRAQQLHAKLSSPSRRRSLHETLKKYQAKQTRALEKRQALQKEKALKIQHLLARVEDVKAAKQCLIEKKRLRMEERLQRAAENRSQYLKDKIKKAHDEEEKLREIAFIKNLEAQNKRLDFLESCKEQEVRLQDLETERQKRAEEKAAKEAAVERRRQEIEQERQKKLQQMSENRREREKRVGKMQEQKERQRQALAREKARDREERLLALQQQKLATAEELQRKIIQKQQESARRHEENIEQIRQRAVEMATIPSRSADELRNDEQDEENSSVSERESSHGGGASMVPKINKKRLKKLRQKLSTAAEEYLSELNPLAPSIRKQSQVPRLLGAIAKGGNGVLGVERPIGQLIRLIAKAEVADFQSLWLLDGLGTIASVIENGLSPGTDVSKKAVVLSVQLYRNACTLCPQIARHAVLGNSILVLLNALLLSMKIPEEKNALFPVELSTELILACTVALLPTSPSPKQVTHPKVAERMPDLLSYIVCIGLVESLVKRIDKVHESIENQTSLVLSLLASLGLLTKLVEICPKGPDVTKLLLTAQSTELFGTISLLYAAVVPIGESIPPRTTSLAAATFNLLVTFANLNVETFQAVLIEENLSLKFLDVISILLQYCVPKADVKSETQTVIIDLIATLGFFCANNKINQDLLTSDQYLCVIKNFAKLPKQFDVLTYPTLVTIIHDNPSARAVVSRDFNVELLDEFRGSDMAKKNRIISLLV
ncbi:S phase cyclin A-associated protein in the endoplasmic reticulum [Anopheles gambiae]|uniref:S phase cyclin A-associated protein in the endoplasmic reticulum n=1 Tax=Anopheles gambiae TaxID=7165 RepID=UPI002AC92DED|nr:S phase cyclin A-associated protein in the endoplasmic reticulum [Anopheles gambiae]XP_061512015.1 S phase cyclin A-associated protein in the endoplasmic reticulum [Anopheles gambiae]XP_061512016.1 S phase cyclin A-associated protein in the endoplasmic reticulum [Anopheles gambiae]